MRIHNLVRAVAPPYPGAFADVAGHRMRFLRSRVHDAGEPPQPPKLVVLDDACIAHCGGGGTLLFKDLEVDGVRVTPRTLASILRASSVSL